MMTSNRNMIPANVYIAVMQYAASMYTPEELEWANEKIREYHLIDFPTYCAIYEGLFANRVFGEQIHFYTLEEIADRNCFLALIDAFIDEHQDRFDYAGPTKKNAEFGWVTILTDGHGLFQAILVDDEIVLFPYHD